MRFPENSKRRGFTLIEILVVIAIITLLAGLTIANVGKLFGGSQVDIAKLFVNQSMKTPLVTYRLQMGSYPSTDEGLQALLTAPANKADRWRGPYLAEGTKLPDPRSLGRTLSVQVPRLPQQGWLRSLVEGSRQDGRNR